MGLALIVGSGITFCLVVLFMLTHWRVFYYCLVPGFFTVQLFNVPS